MTPEYMHLSCATCRHRAPSTLRGPNWVGPWECRMDPPTMFLWKTESGSFEEFARYPIVGTGLDGDWMSACSKHEPPQHGDTSPFDTAPF